MSTQKAVSISGPNAAAYHHWLQATANRLKLSMGALNTTAIGLGIKALTSMTDEQVLDSVGLARTAHCPHCGKSLSGGTE